MSRRRILRGDRAEQPNFWVSYSDLMAGMMLVFVLLLVVALMNFAAFNERKQKVLQAQEEKLKSFQNIQQRLIANLESEVREESVRIDPATGVMQIGSGILFDEGRANLQPEGRTRLQSIFQAYIRVILDDEFREYIKAVEIEGHTNSRGDYLSNLQLSQQRALSVMTFLLEQADAGDRRKLQELVVAGGRSFSYLIYDDQGREDMVRSRRIEIKFRLKESELFADIYQDLEL